MATDLLLSECGTSPRVLNGKCCQLNPDAVSRAFIKLMYQEGYKQTRVLHGRGVSPPITPKSLLVSLCPALVLDMLIASILLMPWHPFVLLLYSPVVTALGPCHIKPYLHPLHQVLVCSRAPWVRLRQQQLCRGQV